MLNHANSLKMFLFFFYLKVEKKYKKEFRIPIRACASLVQLSNVASIQSREHGHPHLCVGVQRGTSNYVHETSVTKGF